MSNKKWLKKLVEIANHIKEPRFNESPQEAIDKWLPVLLGYIESAEILLSPTKENPAAPTNKEER